jgi:hypothetical protein
MLFDLDRETYMLTGLWLLGWVTLPFFKRLIPSSPRRYLEPSLHGLIPRNVKDHRISTQFRIPRGGVRTKIGEEWDGRGVVRVASGHVKQSRHMCRLSPHISFIQGQ